MSAKDLEEAGESALRETERAPALIVSQVFADAKGEPQHPIGWKGAPQRRAWRSAS